MLAFLGETVKRESECNKRDTARCSHRMNNAHTWIEEIAVDADCDEYSAEDVEVVCGDASTLNVFGENEIYCALASGTQSAPAVSAHCCCFAAVCFTFHRARGDLTRIRRHFTVYFQT